MSTGPGRKPLVWVAGEIKTPPFTAAARKEAGDLLSDIQDGESFGMPLSRPMPSAGRGVHELRVNDEAKSFRIFYRADEDSVVIFGVFEKRAQKTPKQAIDLVKRRIKAYDAM